MEEKKIKKKKLTLTVSGIKPYNVPRYTKFGQKKSVVIEKKISRKKNEKRSYGRVNNIVRSTTELTDKTKFKKNDNFIPKNIAVDRNFQIRKIAEERATTRFKNLKEDNLQQKKVT